MRQLLGLPPVDMPAPVWSLVILAYPVAILVRDLPLPPVRHRARDQEEPALRRAHHARSCSSSTPRSAPAACSSRATSRAGASRSGWSRRRRWRSGCMFNPLRTRLQRLIDQRLFPESEAYRQRVLELVADLPSQGKLPRMGEYLCEELCKILGLKSATIWVATPPLGQLLGLASSGRGEPGGDLEQTVLLTPEDSGRQGARPRRAPAAGAAARACERRARRAARRGRRRARGAAPDARPARRRPPARRQSGTASASSPASSSW